MKRPKTNSKKISWFGIVSVFMLAVALAVGASTNAQAATGSLDRDNYLPSLSDTNDYDRAFITVTDSSITTASTDTITVTIKAGTNEVPFVLKETGATTTVFTTTGNTSPSVIGVGTNTGYVPDYSGSHNYPALGVNPSNTVGVTALNLKGFVSQNGGDATSATSGNLNVSAGNTLQLLYGGSTLDTAVVNFNGANNTSITFTTGSAWGNTASGAAVDESVNIIVSIADPDENLNPKLKDVIGFRDGFRAGLRGTSTGRVQVEVIDQNNVDTILQFGGTETVARHVMFVETGNNTGIFTANGKIYGTSTSTPDLRGNVVLFGTASVGSGPQAFEFLGVDSPPTGTAADRVYYGKNITLGGTTTDFAIVRFKLLECSASSARLGLIYTGGTTTAGSPTDIERSMALAFKASTGSFDTTYGTQSWSSTKVVAVGTNSCAFGPLVVLGSEVNGNLGSGTTISGTSTGLLRLVDGSDYCTVLIEMMNFGRHGTTTTTANVQNTVGATYEQSEMGSVTVTIGSFVIAGARTGDTVKVSYLDELTSGGGAGTISSKVVFGTTGEAGTLAVDKTTVDINDFLVITVVDGNLNGNTASKESVASGAWGGTYSTRGDRLSIKAYARAGLNQGQIVGSNTVSVAHPDGNAVGTHTVRISNSDNSLVWVVPTAASPQTTALFGDDTAAGSSTFSLGTRTTSSVPLVRGSSATADSFLNGASISSFTATLDAVDNTVEISPDGTHWIAVPIVESGVNSSTFIGTIGFDFTAARVTTNSTTSNTTAIFTDFTGTSTITFNDAPLLTNVFGTGSVVRITDGTFSEIKEVTGVTNTILTVQKMSNSGFFTPWKTFVQVIGNDMAPNRLDTVSGGNVVFRIGGWFGATYRIRFNDASGASGAYLSGDTLAVTTSNVGFTTSTGELSSSPSGTVGLNSQIVVTLVDNDLNTSVSGVQSTYLPETASRFFLNEVGLGNPAGTTTGNKLYKNGGAAKDIFASNSSSVTSTNVASASDSNSVHIKLLETAVNSGTFKGTFQLSQSDNTSQTTSPVRLKVSNGDTVNIFYNDSPSASSESNLTNLTTVSLSAVGGLGALSVSKTEAFLSGDSVKATVIDNDLNTSAGSLQNTSVIVTSSSDTGSITVTCEETAVNSATFVGTFKTAATTDSAASPKTIRAIGNGTLTVTYQDAFPASNVTASVSTKNFGAVLAFGADSFALNGNATVSLYDPESNSSIASANLLNIGIKSTTDSTGITVRLTETGNDTGSFLGTIGVSSSSTLVNSNIKSSVGDTLTVTFTDSPDATGLSSVVTDIALVTSAAATPTPTPTATATPTATPTPAVGTGALTGFVVSSALGTPITGATVSTDTGGFSQTTGTDGSYTISNVTPGTYTLTASKTGFVSASKTGVTVIAGVTTPVETLDLVPVTVTPTPTVTATATPKPTVTATPVPCEPEKISADPAKSLTLKRKASGVVTVTVTGENDCESEGVTVTATTNTAGAKRISISPASGDKTTDENGEAEFTITAKDKAGNARVTFTAGDAKPKKITVKVKKK